MDTAYLGADYRDAGSNRVIAALDELRNGLINKRDQAIIMADAATAEETLLVCKTIAKTYRAVIDDIALFIAREQGR